jgi:predicted double-glycine peptidase
MARQPRPRKLPTSAHCSQLAVDDLVEMAPLILPVRLGNNNHFIVFRGIVNGRVVFADPAFGNRMQPQHQDLTRVPDNAVNAAVSWFCSPVQ